MSRSADVAVGMMDSAYFVGRMELLQFFNDLLELQLGKIEQTASGAVACQLTEYIFPGSIPLSKINWEAKADYEFVNNYKLLQKAFSKHQVQRHVDVDKLIRAKYQDNLEFCQWLKAFYDQSGAHRDDYDAKAARAKGKGGKKYNDLLQKTASKYGSKPIPAARARTAATRPATKPRAVSGTAQPKARPVLSTRTTARSSNTKGPLTENRNTSAKVTSPASADLLKKNAEMKAKMEELENTVVELEKERDFYFGKLRNVELMLQVKQDANFEGCELEGVVGNIFKVLYATAEEDIEVAGDGEIMDSRTEESADLGEAQADLTTESAVAAELSLLEEAVNEPDIDSSPLDVSIEQDVY